MAHTCEGSHYTCGETFERPISRYSNARVTQTRNRKTSFMLGGTEIIVNQVYRNFELDIDSNWHYDTGAFLIPMSGGPVLCATIINDDDHSVSEDYRCTNTVLYFLDTRYNNAIGKEVIEKLTFSYSGSEMCGFNEYMGTEWYHKFPITNCVIETTTNYFVVIGGTKTTLKTESSSRVAYGPDNPLILVYFNPPANATPWLNCEDIIQYGFYDYHTGGSQELIQSDGGDDFYFTDWMRLIGNASRTQDQLDAAQRYDAYYLRQGAPASQAFSNPGIFTDSTPVGSITRDKDGNVFYSVTLDGVAYNFLTDGNLPELFPLVGTGQYYPVGLA